MFKGRVEVGIYEKFIDQYLIFTCIRDNLYSIQIVLTGDGGRRVVVDGTKKVFQIVLKLFTLVVPSKAIDPPWLDHPFCDPLWGSNSNLSVLYLPLGNMFLR